MLTFETTLKKKGIIFEREENWNTCEKAKTSEPLSLRKLALLLTFTF